MTMISALDRGACDGLVDALRAEFGAVLAARILEAEALDFLWESRLAERYCGQHSGPDIEFADDGETELSRVAIVSWRYSGSIAVRLAKRRRRCSTGPERRATAISYRSGAAASLPFSLLAGPCCETDDGCVGPRRRNGQGRAR